MSSSSDKNFAEQKTSAANSNSAACISITFDGLVQKSGLDEDTLPRRIATVISKRADGSIDEIVSHNAAE